LTREGLHGTRLDAVKGIGSLRGAIIGPDQLFGLAAGLAAAAGIAVREPDGDEPLPNLRP